MLSPLLILPLFVSNRHNNTSVKEEMDIKTVGNCLNLIAAYVIAIIIPSSQNYMGWFKMQLKDYV